MDPLFAQTTGFFGMAIILGAFILNMIGSWQVTDLAYCATNATGSALLIIYAFLIGSWPFFFLNLVWVGFSVRGILSAARR